MASEENDNYWNESKYSKRRNLFDQEENREYVEDAADSVARVRIDSSYETSSFNQNFQIDSLKDYLPERCINCILESENEITDFPIFDSLEKDEKIRLLQRKVKERWIAPSVQDTIDRILLGQTYSLELYRSLSSKKNLLSNAVHSGDGDAILAIVLYCSKTLKKSLFNQLLSDYPVATSHYVHYLFVRRQMQELSDVLEVLGKNKEIIMKYLAVAGENPHRLIQRLKFLLKHPSIENSDRQIIENYSKLVEWQLTASERTKDNSIIGETPVQTLKFAGLHKLTIPLPGDGSKTEFQPNYLAKCLGIHEKQSLIVSVRVNAELKQWETVEKLLIVKGWVGGKKLGTNLPIDRLLHELQKSGATISLLDDILALLDTDRRIEAARKIGRHTVAVDAFYKKKDTAGLLQYMVYLENDSEDYSYAERILRSLGPIRK